MLRIRITKRAHGGAVLRCERGDGSVTWQKNEGRQAPFFVLHDLTHFAVESTLGFSYGFFGLIAAGWDIDDTTGKNRRGALPGEAVEVEFLVGSFDSERASGVRWSAAEFNEHAAIHASSSGRPAPRQLTDEELLRVRSVRSRLFAQWAALKPGESLELSFGAVYQ